MRNEVALPAVVSENNANTRWSIRDTISIAATAAAKEI